ncbi:AraC family transcriptional regulator [Psychroflexus maritimus]|uniref:AraC family transcriptional regulator n=1 Tax=Psychroflexus maritimus TaxID=2714865 RepID=A0A967AGF1_9FLAO|nr:AraC family transcriptional regulator [Psychroflexus maritimus]NGZ90778.1 AraC family transcriptional regulator [Psychroflexus maritimus]
MFSPLSLSAQDLSLFYTEYQDLIVKEKYALANSKLDSLLQSPIPVEGKKLDLLLKKASLYGLLKVQDSALYYLDKTIAQAKSTNNTDVLNRANTNLGMLLNQIGRPEEALSHYKKHYQFVQNLPPTQPNLVRRIIANYNMGLTFFRLNEIDSARTYLDDGLRLATSEKNYTGIAKINGLLSEINYSAGQDWKANLSLAYQAAKQSNDSIGLLKAHLTSAEFNEASGNINQVIKELDQAEILIKRTPENISLWLKFHQLKYKAFKRINNYQQSLAELELYLKRKEKLDSLNQANAINVFNERIKIYEKDLKNSKLLVQQKEKINHLTLLSALLGAFVFISLGFLFLKSKLTRFRRKLFKINRLNENTVNLSKDKISSESKILFEEIQQQMKDKQLYLDHNINLNYLAQLVNSNSNYVSEAINLFTGNNFSTFINKNRIRFTKEKIVELQDQEYLNFNDIAAMSGFNSTSHFYRVFKQITGLTPRQYLKFIQESNQNRES